MDCLKKRQRVEKKKKKTLRCDLIFKKKILKIFELKENIRKYKHHVVDVHIEIFHYMCL